MFTDYVLNGSPRGEVANALAGMHFDPGLMRPFLDKKDRACVTVNTGKTETRRSTDGTLIDNGRGTGPKRFPIFETQLISNRLARGLACPTVNATLLRKDQWIMLDEVILEASRDRLKAWADLRAANTYGGFDGMANPILEWERVTDVGEAVADMDGMTEGRAFSPKFDLQGMPLPIFHSDFFLSSRFLATSRNKGTPADTIRSEMAGRRIGELIEKTCIGVVDGVVYGTATDYASATSQVYGYINHPDVITYTSVTAPTGGAGNGEAILTNWLAMRELLYAQNFYGPFMVYHSTDWDQYLDNLFSTTEPSAGTLRQRLLEIDGIQDIRRLDYLPSATYPTRLIWVEMKPENVRAVNGMEITTVQWESMGGMRLNFKVMCIQVPQVRSRYIGMGSTTKAGILYGTPS